MLGLLALGLSAVATQAQTNEPDAFINQQRLLEEQVRTALDEELPATQRTAIDWGGWYSFYTFLYDDGVNSSRTFRQHDGRLWASASVDEGAHQFYGRVKLQHEDWNSGDSYDGNDNDWVGPNLDRAYYQFDLRNAMRAYRGENLDWNMKFKVGRDYMELGTGYALSWPMDHVLLTVEANEFEFKALMGRSVPSTYDIEQSRPVSSNSDRNFFGGQIRYLGWEKHKPFIYYFYQDDQYDNPLPHFLQDYDYETWYLGLGSVGELVKNLRYGTELVFEGGKSFGDGHWENADRVCAWGFDAGLEYLMVDKPLRPKLVFEYMFASGDGDRRLSPTDAAGGNTRGGDDGFSGFGYRYTGLSLAPRLSNLHVWRAGAAFVPFESIESLQNMELGTDWFLYCKNKGGAAISDPTADEASNYVGWEMDYYLNWRVTSDLAWTARFGSFFPGKAYSDRTTRTFVLVGVTYSF